jgi:hypothetical protein
MRRWRDSISTRRYDPLGSRALSILGRVCAYLEPDPRTYDALAEGLTSKQRALANSTSPVTTQAQRRLAALEAGEPQLIPLWAISPRQFPDAAARIPFLALKVHDTAEERAESATMVRVYPDDRVEIGQTYAQREEQSRLVDAGYVVGEIDEHGDYVPLGLNPETGEWEPIGTDDNVEIADMSRDADGWHLGDSDRVEHLFEQ